MTLHEIIEQLLREEGRMLSTRELADLVNEDGSYVKRDKMRVTDFQIHGRTRNHPSIFVRDGSLVGLREWDRAADQVDDDLLVQSESIPRLETVEDHADVSMITYLEKTGFKRIGTVGELLRSGLPTERNLKRCGLYAVTLPKGFTPCFLSPKEVLKKGNVIRPREEDYLREKWVKDVDVVYYGIAGSKSCRTLAERLDDLLRHANGKTYTRGPHSGGEILWQLSDYDDFTIWALPTDGPPAPRTLETALLRTFKKVEGKLPFANRQL